MSVWLGVALLLSGAASAHKNYWNPDSSAPKCAYPLGSDPVTSFYVGYLGPGERDFYWADLLQALPVTFGLMTPQACPGFAPQLWVVGHVVGGDEAAPFPVPNATACGRRGSRTRGRSTATTG